MLPEKLSATYSCSNIQYILSYHSDTQFEKGLSKFNQNRIMPHCAIVLTKEGLSKLHRLHSLSTLISSIFLTYPTSFGAEKKWILFEEWKNTVAAAQQLLSPLTNYTYFEPAFSDIRNDIFHNACPEGACNYLHFDGNEYHCCLQARMFKRKIDSQDAKRSYIGCKALAARWGKDYRFSNLPYGIIPVCPLFIDRIEKANVYF